MGFLKTTDQPTTFHRSPTNQPTDPLPLTIHSPINNHMHRPLTYQSPTSKKFEYHKKIEFIFDITYDFKSF